MHAAFRLINVEKIADNTRVSPVHLPVHFAVQFQNPLHRQFIGFHSHRFHDGAHGRDLWEPDRFVSQWEFEFICVTGVHPKDSTEQNIANMEQTLREMGAMFDWDAEIKTCHEDYYKWTQWLFLKLYEKGLAYRKEAPVNWCPDCKTVLANEQVVDGKCERCGATVVKKDLTQWFFKITEYAEELLQGLNDLDWPEKTKLMQKNWIGKSTGGEIEKSG